VREVRRIDQYLERVAIGDADTALAFERQGAAWRAGVASDVYARDVPRELEAFVTRVDARPAGVDGALAQDPLPSLQLVVLSSAENDGIKPYADAIIDGLRANGHEVFSAGVRRANDDDLFGAIRNVPAGAAGVIVEHEFALFRDVSLVRALLSLRRRGVPVVLSLHELEPGKFHHYRLLTKALHYRQRLAWPIELARAPWVALRLAWRFARFRAVLFGLGALPRKLVIHSARSRMWIDLLTADAAKIAETPLVVRPLEGVELPKDDAEKRRLRERLGLPLDRFIFISPGFFFRRKRLIEVIGATPRDALIVLSGTEADYAEYDRGYLDEIRRYVADRGLDNVVINSSFDTMGDYVAASDAVVLFYEDVFQSGVATQSLWAELPIVFSDLPSFRAYAAAGLFARDTVELRARMSEIRDPETHARLKGGARFLKELLAPARQAPRYLVGLR
jgi:hypothetical protein